MNWYKKANLWDEIKKYGPYDREIDPDDPTEEERIKYIQDTYKYDREKAIRNLNDQSLFKHFLRRDYFTKNYGWSVPDKEAIEEIKKFVGNDEVLEIASGYGMWAKLMQDSGINVVATDVPKSSHYLMYNPKEKQFANIEDSAPPEAIQKYSSRNVLMMSWPPYDDPMAYNIVKSFKGNKLIFIGEGKGGCTANEDFFEELNENWKLVKDVEIPRWVGIYDHLSFYFKK